MDVVIVVTASSLRHAKSLADGLMEQCTKNNYESCAWKAIRPGSGFWLTSTTSSCIFSSRTCASFSASNPFGRNLPHCMAKCPRCPPVTQNPPGTKTKPPAPRKCIMSLTPTLLLILDATDWLPPVRAMPPALRGRQHRSAHLPAGRDAHRRSGRAVGLPAGYMGNSEVGHLNIGAGRIVYQDMTRIDVAMETGELAPTPRCLSCWQT